MVSKPVTPPWNDSSKNLVRDIVLGTSDAHFTVLTDGRGVFGAEHVEELPLYRGSGRGLGGFAPSVRQNARVVGLLLRPGDVEMQHFFFAPNPRTSRIVGAVRRLKRKNRRPAVHTVCSVPKRFERIDKLLFADITVAVSRYTAQRLREAGVKSVRHIPPAVPPLEPRLDADDRKRCRDRFNLPHGGPVVVFPGDYEFGQAAPNLADAALSLCERKPAITWVFACRIKTAAAREVEARLRDRLQPLEEAGRVVFLNQVDRIYDLLTAADLVVLPTETTYAKMDLPLVLLETMALGRPFLVADVPPLDELPVREAGFDVPPANARALAEAIDDALSDEERLIERGRRGAELARSRYDRGKMAAEYVKLYEGLRR